MTSDEMELHASLAEWGVPPTIDGVFAFEAALTISYNLLKTWWPGTELNRRRQPFQGCALPPELPGHIAIQSFASDIARAREHAWDDRGVATKCGQSNDGKFGTP